MSDGDYSLSSIDRNRNEYLQRKLSIELESEMESLLVGLTRSIRNHLNSGQNLTVNLSESMFHVERTSVDSIPNRTIELNGRNRIRMADKFSSNLTMFDSFRVRSFAAFRSS